eukprot:gene17006-20393_t
MIFLCCIFVALIEKDGGIRPCEVLATCAYKVLHSTGTKPMFPKDKLNIEVLTGISNKPFSYCHVSQACQTPAHMLCARMKEEE